MSVKRRVVVTGLGVVAPNGVGLEDYRAALKAGKSGISWHEQLKKLNFAAQIGGVPPLDHDQIDKVLPPADSRKLCEWSLVMALTGGMLLPYLTGVLGSTYGLRASLLIVPAALLGSTILLMHLRSRKLLSVTTE